MRLHIFLVEADLSALFEIVHVEAQDETHRRMLGRMREQGGAVSLPAIEHGGGWLEVDSRVIIERLMDAHELHAVGMPLLAAYERGMLPRFGKMFGELRRLKGEEWNGIL